MVVVVEDVGCFGGGMDVVRLCLDMEFDMECDMDLELLFKFRKSELLLDCNDRLELDFRCLGLAPLP